MALGAAPGSIARLVVSRGAAAMGLGLVLGLALSSIAGRWIEPLLFHVSPVDRTVYVVVAIVLGITTLIAAYLPSRRAERTDPLAALRAE